MFRTIFWFAAAAVPTARAGAAPETGALYEWRATATPKLKTGASGVVKLQIVPRRGAHITKDAPFTVRLAGPAFLSLAKATLANADVAYAADSARVEVPFSALSAGAAKVEVSVDFVVCTDTGCERKREAASLPVTVR
jgi:hypothetical protein